MKKILFSMMMLATVLFSANVMAQVSIATFETDELPFDRSPGNSGSSSGIITSTDPNSQTENSTADLDATEAHSGSQSQKIVLMDNPMDNNSLWVRYLSKGGSPAANETVYGKIQKSGYLELWLKTSTAPSNAKIGFLIDDSNGYILTSMLSVINDGMWHSYSWDLNDAGQFGNWPAVASDGVLDGPFTLDAIIFEGDANYSDWTFWIDDVAQVSEISTGINELTVNSAKIYPNVVTDEMTLEFNLDRNKNINVEIFDYQGRRVFTENMNINSGNSTRKIDMSNLASSMYIAKLKGDNFDQSLKIIKK